MVLQVEPGLLGLVVGEVVFAFSEGMVATAILVLVVRDGGGEGDAGRGYRRAVGRIVVVVVLVV